MLEDDTGFHRLRHPPGQCSLLHITSFFTAKPPPCVYTGQERILQCRAAKPAFLEEKGENMERRFPGNPEGACPDFGAIGRKACGARHG